MALPQRRILFISLNDGAPWGGSEELWSRAAGRLAEQGYPVSASVREWVPPHERVLNLMERGVEVCFQPARFSLWKRAWCKVAMPQINLFWLEVQRFVAARSPRLVVFSDAPFPPAELLEMCNARQWPFVTIAQANLVEWWPDDCLAGRYRTALASALRCYFVSKENRRLAEKQLGCELPNAEIVWNPFNVDIDTLLPWPPVGRDGELRLACVARLDPPSKGQDLLFEVLARPTWLRRSWSLHLYGDGPRQEGLERLAQRLGLADRVLFEGHVDPQEIWSLNHVLVMPSRYEGLPLAMVEAMLCGRAVVATDVAGHSEVIEDGVVGFLAEAPTVGALAEALERFWSRRAEAQEIGAAAAKRIRQLAPSDPVRIFSEKLKALVAVKEAG